MVLYEGIHRERWQPARAPEHGDWASTEAARAAAHPGAARLAEARWPSAEAFRDALHPPRRIGTPILAAAAAVLAVGVDRLA